MIPMLALVDQERRYQRFFLFGNIHVAMLVFGHTSGPLDQINSVAARIRRLRAACHEASGRGRRVIAIIARYKGTVVVSLISSITKLAEMSDTGTREVRRL